MDKTVAGQAITKTHRVEDLNAPLFEDPGTDSGQDVIPAAQLQDHALDSVGGQETRQQRARGATTNDYNVKRFSHDFPLHQHQYGLFDIFFENLQELGPQCAVYRPVIDR